MFLFRCARAASPEITGLAAFFLRRYGGAAVVKVRRTNYFRISGNKVCKSWGLLLKKAESRS